MAAAKDKLTPSAAHTFHPANLRWFKVALRRMVARMGPIQVRMFMEDQQ